MVVGTGESYLCGQMSSSQHEAQRAAGDHGDDGQRQQPVLLQEVRHVSLQVLLHCRMEESLHLVPHHPPCVSWDIRAVVRARLLLAAW